MQPAPISNTLEISKLPLQSCVQDWAVTTGHLSALLQLLSVKKNLAGLCPRFLGDSKPLEFHNWQQSLLPTADPQDHVFYINRWLPGGPLFQDREATLARPTKWLEAWLWATRHQPDLLEEGFADEIWPCGPWFNQSCQCNKNPIKPLDSEMQVSVPGNHKLTGQEGESWTRKHQVSTSLFIWKMLVCILYNKMLILSTAPSWVLWVILTNAQIWRGSGNSQIWGQVATSAGGLQVPKPAAGTWEKGRLMPLTCGTRMAAPVLGC